ncbi:MAG: nucleoside triphosphate pyrophosphohydrolase [Lentimicrobium sp.]|jgi:XTP/dITP diphosphohydrolase|nr:nucleoside triphosphate pyrophosphohydrolase [Lentimicrobium sp.]
MDARLIAFERLLDIMDQLRKGCPWDRKQTLESLRYLTIEETYELSDAILDKDMDEIKKELGDLMLHLVFYSKIASEQQAFDITDVLDSISEKLIRRHPHIFGDVTANDAKTVSDNWEKIKLTEGRKTVLGGVPKSLPAMVKAYRIQEKVRGVGFDWDHVGQVWDKVQEELNELQYEKLNGSPEKIEDEFGDLLFALINYARFIEVNPEDALERTNKKFISRFNHIEQRVNEQHKNMHDMSLSELDVLWDEAKSLENKG